MRGQNRIRRNHFRVLLVERFIDLEKRIGIRRIKIIDAEEPQNWFCYENEDEKRNEPPLSKEAVSIGTTILKKNCF